MPDVFPAVGDRAVCCCCERIGTIKRADDNKHYAVDWTQEKAPPVLPNGWWYWTWVCEDCKPHSQGELKL